MVKDFLDHLVSPEQRSQEWHDQRCGKFTSSENHRLVTEVWIKRDMTEEELAARPKKGTGSRTTTIEYEIPEALSKGAVTYVKEKVGEELTGVTKTLTLPQLDWGNEMEPRAREAYNKRYNTEIRDARFVPFLSMAGGSPDGYDTVEIIGPVETVIEIKCPYEVHNTIDFWFITTPEQLKQEHPDYYWQVQSNMLFCKMEHSRLVIYDPRMPEDMQLYVIEVPANPEDQNRLALKLGSAAQLKKQLLKELSDKIKVYDRNPN
jgi:hypothetical protein